jgi:hypothetical protein
VGHYFNPKFNSRRFVSEAQLQAVVQGYLLFTYQSPLRGFRETQETGGADRDRTGDLMLAKHALSQLSYSPNNWWAWVESNYRPHPYQGCALTN